MAQEQKIWCSPLTGKIFQGMVNTKTNVASKKRDITDEAVNAVFEHFYRHRENHEMEMKNGDILNVLISVTKKEHNDAE
ncbi:hypothetical protein KKJ01_14595 [Xenorhabdus bovienii]|uniref:Uncharacterized protein n=1 Tax=Xenorhabdus bovienii TaxID=40576 RepID=A0AAJ1JCP2_XENBV|nr:hypothetical protein [Xenorhabdus bovienii]MDE1479428.1 hypothetical protein [Xenorhabdus bovienii]MDE9511079.1 hypothetical protein [Xenorhabdus bovienii]MDE9522736.1 hypothetical protein [Xenorhabdus bovienii]